MLSRIVLDPSAQDRPPRMNGRIREKGFHLARHLVGPCRAKLADAGSGITNRAPVWECVDL